METYLSSVRPGLPGRLNGMPMWGVIEVILGAQLKGEFLPAWWVMSSAGDLPGYFSESKIVDYLLILQKVSK